MTLWPFHSLQFKFAVGLVATISLLSAIYVTWDYWFHRRQLLSGLKESATQISNITLHGLLEVAMLGNHPELLQEAVENLSADSDVRKVFLLDESGVVRFSSEVQDLGRRFGLEDPGCAECHSRSSNLENSVLLEGAGGQILRSVTLVPNDRKCHTCHDSSEPTRGVLIVDLPTASGVWARLRVNLYEMVAMAVMTLLATVLMVYVLMNTLVSSRLRKLTDATSMLAEHRVAAQVSTIEGPDEIGRLATAFNRMATSLRSYWVQIEEKEQVRLRLLDRLVRGEEELRKSMSRELHDQLGQSLSALLMRFRTSRSTGSARGAVRQIPIDTYNDMESQIRAMLDEVHRLAWEMRPSILDDYGLESALGRYIEKLSSDFDIQVDYVHTSPAGAGRPPDWVEVTLYRIAQEALTNMVKHSKAKRASVVLLTEKDRVTLLVEDSGCGFDPEAAQTGAGRGLGLIGMKERVALCGGNFTMESARGKGTTIRIRIPLMQTTDHRTESGQA